MTDIIVRAAQPIDVHQINTIFNYYVDNAGIYCDPKMDEKVLATFQEKMTTEERKKWMAQYSLGTSKILLVAQKEGEVIGFTFSGKYRESKVFSHTLKAEIYIHPEHLGQGHGPKLLTVLAGLLTEAEFHRLLCEILLPNTAAIKMLTRIGFTEVGVFQETIHHRGTFLNSLWMQKRLEPLFN